MTAMTGAHFNFRPQGVTMIAQNFKSGDDIMISSGYDRDLKKHNPLFLFQ